MVAVHPIIRKAAVMSPVSISSSLSQHRLYGAADSGMICTATIAEPDGLVCRAGDPDELAEVVRRVGAGEKPFAHLKPDEIHELLDCVDDSDRAILAMLLEGAHPDDVAGTLGLSARTVRVRCQTILRRLDPGRFSPASS